MAAKGYVVLYTNPRGSSNYGQDFGNIIQYNYPGDDYKDLMAGVDEVLKKGYVDETRLGVTGGSGGGLLTNWVVTQTSRFKAAVSQRDISDWANFWYTADFTLFTPTWFRKAPFEDPVEYARRSPITHVAKIQTPLMFILGDEDWRTPPAAGGEDLFRALKYLKRPTVMVRFPGESHELSRSGRPWHRVERLQHIVGWFDKWLLGKETATYEPPADRPAAAPQAQAEPAPDPADESQHPSRRIRPLSREQRSAVLSPRRPRRSRQEIPQRQEHHPLQDAAGRHAHPARSLRQPRRRQDPARRDSR